MSTPSPGPEATENEAELAARLVAEGRRLVLLGVTRDGRSFRPSDWSERLASVLSSYRPGRAGKAQAGGKAQAARHFGYSPLVAPSERDGVRCVIADPGLRAIEPLAWAFVFNFARDNDLQVVEEPLASPGTH